MMYRNRKQGKKGSKGQERTERELVGEEGVRDGRLAQVTFFKGKGGKKTIAHMEKRKRKEKGEESRRK